MILEKTALKDQVTAATLVTAVHQIEQNVNTLNQAMHGLRQSIRDNAATKAMTEDISTKINQSNKTMIKLFKPQIILSMNKLQHSIIMRLIR